jgi:hypothetical protein
MENLKGYKSLVGKGIDDNNTILDLRNNEERTCTGESLSTFELRSYIMELVC